MARFPRIVLPNPPLHLIQRGNNRQACFFSESGRHIYLESLAAAAGRHGCLIHAYVLMTNHVNLLVDLDRTSRRNAFAHSEFSSQHRDVE